jgi:predicted CoA-substrate-specific enzyme activase
MKISEVLDRRLPDLPAIRKGYGAIGIDIGSRTSKAALLTDGELHLSLIGTGFDMQETANELIENLLEESGLRFDRIDHIAGTGYGRVGLNFPNKSVSIISEISCHALGMHYLDADTRTIIDIGGQDSKAIKIDASTGKVIHFVMNDKCAAGTGRFLEMVADLLGLSTEELGRASLRSRKDLTVNSTCVVFAESEIISFRARGETPEDIAAGVHFATASRVFAQLKRVDPEPCLRFSGGVSNNEGMLRAFEDLTGEEIRRPKLDAVFAGCLGAAIHALRAAAERDRAEDYSFANYRKAAGLRGNTRLLLEEAIGKSSETFTAKKDGAKRVGYYCSYTPLELFSAAGVRHRRMMHAGTPEEVALGERLTQSTVCDFIKGALGAFENGNPVNKALDVVFSFHTCVGMLKTAESIRLHYVPAEIFTLPRKAYSENSREQFCREFKNLKESLEKLTGRPLRDEMIREQIALYNQARQRIRDISELRKRPDPPITGAEFLEIIKGYYYIEPRDYLPLLDRVHRALALVPESGRRPVRLLMLGGIVGDGDTRLARILEEDLGARIVAEDHCTGLSAVYCDRPEGGDPLRALSDGYLDQAPCAVMTPVSKRVDFAARLIEEYGAEGVVFSFMKFCSSYGMAKSLFIKRFHELGLPVLELVIDYSQNDDGQIKTRAEAFIEVLEERRRERKDA